MEAALIGLTGVLLGILLNELLRRKNRIEGYAARVFDKRLEVYEGLYERVSACSQVAADVIENADYSSEDRHAIVSAAIHEIAGWCDKHDMYINEEITVHCVPLLMGIEEVHDIPDVEKKEQRIRQFRESLVDAKRMIRKEAGIADIERVFTGITKPKHSSPVIEYYRTKKKELGIKGKWD